MIESMKNKWMNLRRKYLPYSSSASIWRYNIRLPSSPLPEQGWKIHLSASLLTAGQMLETVAPFLWKNNVSFKAPATLDELIKINTGIFYGYSQVGKFITVYPANDAQFVYLAERLDRLTGRFTGSPAVPFDFSYRKNSCVYYRFGSFNSGKSTNLSDEKSIFDNRETGFFTPSGVVNPIPQKKITSKPSPASPLQNSYRVFRALTQRGKGGVYEAIDVKHSSPRLCIVKEGRKGGEMTWDGRDGFWRVKNEARILTDLYKQKIAVPEIYDCFESNSNFYLVSELIEGENLQKVLSRRKRRLSITKALEYGLQISEILSKIHRAGWVWRDCKPSNMILTKQGILRPIDFEGTVSIGKPDALCWSSPFFAPAEAFDNLEKQTNLPEDLFALGAVLYFLFEGSSSLTTIKDEKSFVSKRRGLPRKVKRIIKKLLGSNPKHRPSAESVNRLLQNSIFS